MNVELAFKFLIDPRISLGFKENVSRLTELKILLENQGV